MEIHLTNQNFASEVLESQVPVLVDFWAPWCGPCRLLGPIITELAQKYEGKIKIGKLNVDEEPELSTPYNILSIPTMKFFVHGQVVDELVGLCPAEEIENKITKYISQ